MHRECKQAPSGLILKSHLASPQSSHVKDSSSTGSTGSKTFRRRCRFAWFADASSPRILFFFFSFFKTATASSAAFANEDVVVGLLETGDVPRWCPEEFVAVAVEEEEDLIPVGRWRMIGKGGEPPTSSS